MSPLEIPLTIAKASNNSDNSPNNNENKGSATNWTNVAFFASIAILYWYLMVFGAAAKVNGWPVPDFVPMTPGWPATEEDFVPVVEDAYHFFYLSEVLQNQDVPYVIPPRLALFNVVEAWMFAYLPALWKDPKRLPRPILLGAWLILGINLTNAFLAPYLAITEAKRSYDDDATSSYCYEKNRVISAIFGSIVVAVTGFAVVQSVTVATSEDWAQLGELVQSDRTYFAFGVDPVLLAIFQPMILARASHNSSRPLDYVPFVGLIAWLFRGEEENE